MTDKELREIKRRWRADKSNVSRIVGCFVNSSGQILSRINQSLTLGESDLNERLLTVMRKALSGSIGVALSELDFSTRSVESGEEHALLMRLRDSELRDSDALERFYSLAAESLKLETSYVILLANDVYDVPTRTSDGEEGESTSRFSYVVCAVCPIKEPPESLTFTEEESLFHLGGSRGILASPELGFMFPAFDARATNIYGALLYTRGAAASYPDFTTRIFGKSAPMPRAVQKETFNTALSEALGDDCSLELVRAVHAAVGEMVEQHKESRDPEPLLITKHTLNSLLSAVGVEEEKLSKIGEAMDESFGKGAALVPKNVISQNRFELKMPEVKISISPEHRDLVSTREINGESCIVIRVTGPVEINGITVNPGSGCKTDGEE